MKKVAGTREKPIWMTYKARKAVDDIRSTGNIKIQSIRLIKKQQS